MSPTDAAVEWRKKSRAWKLMLDEIRSGRWGEKLSDYHPIVTKMHGVREKARAVRLKEIKKDVALGDEDALEQLHAEAHAGKSQSEWDEFIDVSEF